MPATVDTSMYNTASLTPINPLATLSQVAQTQNALNQNKLFQQTNAARQAIGTAYQQSIDPQTGQLDSNKLMGIVANNPNAAYLAGDVASQAQARQKQQIDINTAQLQNAMSHAQQMNGYFGALAAKPDLSSRDVINTAGDMIAQGLQTPQAVATELATMPQDPAQLRQWVQKYQMRQIHGMEQIKASLPQPTPIANGAGTQFVDTNPITNPNAAGQRVGNQLSPQDMAAPATWVDPTTGRTMTGTNAMRLHAMDGGAMPPGTVPGATPAPGGTLGTGRMNTPAPATPLVGALAPDETAALGTSGTAAGGALADASKAAATYPNRMFQLSHALTGLQGAGETGPGTDTRNTVLSYVQSLPYIGGAAKGLGITDPKQIADYDTANKYLTQYAENQAGSFGGKTDLSLATAITGNASTHISNLAAQDVVKANMALERMRQAGTMAFVQSGEPPQSYNKYITKWASTVDPRAFAVSEMTLPQVKSMLDQMKPAEKAAFGKSYSQAVQSGLVTPPGQANAGQ